ncbi:MAG: acyl-homoserine-lactone synthase [Pseudomonadota bacterium]
MQTIMVNWKTAGKHHRQWLQHHELRHQIFVDRLGWDVGSYEGLEFDEFDTPAAHYVLCLDDNRNVVGVSRLVSTEQPYMIEKLWPDWLQGELPKSDVIWEATRFGVCNVLNAEQRAAAIDAITRRIFRYGQENGIEEFLLVMPVFIYKRILIPRGYDLEIVSSVRRVDQLNSAIARVRIPQVDEAPTTVVHRTRAARIATAMQSGARAAYATMRSRVLADRSIFVR